MFIMAALVGCNGGKDSGGNNTAKVEFPALPKEYAVSNNVTGAALQQYIYARLKLEQLTQAETPEAFETLIAETIEAFQYADEFAVKAVQYADYAAMANEDNPKAKENGKILKTAAAAKAGGNPFVMTAYAAEDEKFDAKAWAEDVTKKYDAGTAGQQVKNLAEQLGVDAKEAYNQLLAAQDIIKKGADADAAFFDTAMKAAMATKTACKVGLLVAGTVASGGVLASVTVPSAAITTVNAAVFAVNAADCIVDIGVTTSTIVLGENHEVTAAFNGMAEDLAPFASVAGGVGLFTLPFGSTIERATSVFDYVGNSLADYMVNDKVIGIDVSKKQDGKTEVTATAIDIPQTSDGKVDAEKLTGDLEQAKLPAIPTEEPAPKPIDKVIEEVKKDIPDPADVSKQIDEALAEIKALLIELGKIEDMPDVVGMYSGTCHYTETDADGDSSDAYVNFTAEISASVENSNDFNVRLIIHLDEGAMPLWTFTGQFNKRHFQGSFKKVDGVDTHEGTMSFDISDIGDSLVGEAEIKYFYHNPGSGFDDDWSITNITLNMTKQ
jgi:hypothetical protein